MNTETATQEAPPQENASRVESSDLDVLVIDNWLVFDCPNCQQTVKIARQDAIHVIECPSCGMEFDPILEKAPRSEARADRPRPAAVGQRRTAAAVRRRLKEERMVKPHSDLNRPSLSTLPSKGHVTLSIQQKVADEKESAKTANLPQRSARELETRIVAASNKPLHPDEENERLINQEIAEVSGGDYKRVRVRTRVRKQTEAQWQVRFWSFVLLGGAAIGGLCLAVAKSMHHQELVAPVGAVDTADAEGPKIKTWIELVDKFGQAKTADQLIPLIRKPRALEANLKAAYPEGLPPFEVKRAVVRPGVDLPPGFQQVDAVLSEQVVPLFMEQSKAYGWRLDWESHAGLGSVPWKTFIESKSQDVARLRAFASKADFWQGDFTDKSALFCVRLEDVTRKHSVYAYGPQFSVVTKKLQTLVMASSVGDIAEADQRRDVRVIVDLRFPPQAKNNSQVEIVQLFRDNWVVP